ncbi:hypothetical protein ANO11243_047160 [Dothideomycetidae sp. 11243]|nr:hypothetical protein ANO11243_047160 [fungal sp. No.11243]
MASPSVNLVSAYPLAVVQAVLAAVVVCLDIPPLIWHAKQRNFAPVVLILYILLLNFANFVNAIVWPNDDLSRWFSGVGLCDIEARLAVAGSTALPAATLCILRKLANVMDTKHMIVSPTRAQKRRALLIEILLCIGIPVLSMALHFIVQPLRYIVYGISGCTPAMSSTWLSIAFIVLPPLLLTLVDVYYAVLIAFRLRKYRARFDSLLSAASTSKTRFLRLFLLALTFILGVFPIQLWVLLLNWPSHLEPFVWSEIHGLWSWKWIPLVPAFGTVLPDRWIRLACGILVFIFFGLGKEAKDMYMSWAASLGLDKLVRRLRSTSSMLYHSSRSSFGSARRSFSSVKGRKTGLASSMTDRLSNTTTDSTKSTNTGEGTASRASDASDVSIRRLEFAVNSTPVQGHGSGEGESVHQNGVRLKGWKWRSSISFGRKRQMTSPC